MASGSRSADGDGGCKWCFLGREYEYVRRLGARGWILDTARGTAPVHEGGWATSSQACLPGTACCAPTTGKGKPATRVHAARKAAHPSPALRASRKALRAVVFVAGLTLPFPPGGVPEAGARSWRLERARRAPVREGGWATSSQASFAGHSMLPPQHAEAARWGPRCCAPTTGKGNPATRVHAARKAPQIQNHAPHLGHPSACLATAAMYNPGNRVASLIGCAPHESLK